MALGWRPFFFPHKPNSYRAFPLCGQILVCWDLMNSASLTLMSPWDPAPPQRSAGTWWGPTRLGVPWDFCWVASYPALAPSLNFYQTDKHHSPLPGDSLRTYLMQHEYHQRLFQWLIGIRQVEAARRLLGENIPGTILQLLPRTFPMIILFLCVCMHMCVCVWERERERERERTLVHSKKERKK